ncbi:MAG: nickel pincer cofactor biosynthesis protein LarC [Verrucomicrobia bacterium]|nr:nickel pincer cofactor biosynthesis protein LarC [Verrucomicrobiota bacterium]MCF7707593.1 nickel pincer cofactor biosynthesis protein LarC [Verrucomicrobiota bacterium]
MRTIHLDAFSGISGDMFLGAMIDLGADINQIESVLNRLAPEHFELKTEKTKKHGITGTRLTIITAEDHGHAHTTVNNAHNAAHTGHHEHLKHGNAHVHSSPNRDFTEIQRMIRQAELSDWTTGHAISVFERISVAEGKIHGVPPEKVHFHEVGALDSIIDIVGACLALEQLDKPRVECIRLFEGRGFVKCAHGNFPVPTPATLEILSRCSAVIDQCEEPHELITPTGAALVAEFAESFGPMRLKKINKIGYGIGTKNLDSRPNVLRAVLTESIPSPDEDTDKDEISVIETNLDDVTPETAGHILENALHAGALDAFITPIQMKKNRPGFILTVLCKQEDTAEFCNFLIRETGAFGVRFHTTERRKLIREFAEVHTEFGPVQIKKGYLNGRIISVKPEYESCKALAEKSKTPLRKILDAARRQTIQW